MPQAGAMLRLIVSAAVLAASSAGSTVPLQPTGKWTIDYAKDYCVLSRDPVGTQLGVAFRTRPLAELHDVLIYGPRTNAPGATSKGQVAAGDGELGALRSVEEVEPKEKAYRFVIAILTKEELDAVGKEGSMRVKVDGKFDLRVPIPQIEKAFAALRACEDDLARRWSLDTAYLRNWKTPPKPKLTWDKVRKDEWPDWNRNWGKNKASFTVDETGKVIACHIVESSGSRRMDKALCDGVSRMPFDPALDAEGRPVRSAQMFGMYWSLRWETRYEFWPR
jgi:TonB family protein